LSEVYNGVGKYRLLQFGNPWAEIWLKFSKLQMPQPHTFGPLKIIPWHATKNQCVASLHRGLSFMQRDLGGGIHCYFHHLGDLA